MEKNRTTAEFFAQGYRVSGTFYVVTRPLADEVHDPTTDYVPLHDAYVSPIMNPSRISAYYRDALFDKNNLDFVLTVDQRDGLRRDQRFGLGRYSFKIFLTVPFFEVQGELRLVTPKLDSRVYLSSEAGTFITLLNVTARSTFNPDVQYEGGVAMVSRLRVSFFGERVE
ncbi:MAG TPA: hypothetical protein PKH77_16060 [Anaerolineae bacterium]|nr:hypothetical protein [Anaerolineae bacterium]